MPEPRAKLEAMRLYALLTERHCRRPWRETAELLLAGGADVIQLREKDLPDAELLARARILREMTAEAGALLIINDRPDVALVGGADGVHLGQDDLPPAEVRKLIGPDMLVGWSTHSAEHAAQAQQLPVDYIGVGPVHPTDTKGYETGKGAELVRQVCARVQLPTVAIGGITRDNAAAAVEAGATAIAACSALCGVEDPEAAARELRAVVEEARRAWSDPDE
ncbi:MAG: thiamine phosphate synthase [Planctomycetota bacterium]|jgi:thiamine-phosphate pyrophosphorylase